MRYGVIMAGGSGTRLWPLSRKDQPKQLLPLVKGKSLLQLSFDRLSGFLPPERIYVCTGAAHADAIRANLPDLPAGNLLGEPEGRDTANAVGFPAAVLYEKDPDAVFAIVTAAHVIEPIDGFRKSLDAGFRVAEEHPESLVTFGIIPTHGHTGLGYIQRGEALPAVPGSFRVQAFKEKPDKATADKYVESGRYYWNSGMFVWRAETILKQLAKQLPDNYEKLKLIGEAWGHATEQARIQELYPQLKKISVDYGVMEPAGREGVVNVVEMKIDWLDVGSWPALAETLDVDANDNAVDAAKMLQINCDGNIIVSRDPEHLICLIGVSDMVIAQTEDATLICPKSEAQQVKEMVGKIKDAYGEKFN
ncbi:MAG: mannose-1-phosphate guanylyltransferase [Phycisphaerae bacterium]